MIHQQLAKIPKGTFQSIGSSLGGMYGQSALGGALGSAVSRITGYGDYVANSLIKDTRGLDQNSIPKFSAGSKSTRITHSEYLGDVTSTSAFTTLSYTVNPANTTTFPWLSTIASSFEKYRFRGLVFSYRTLSSEYNATSQSLGAVIAAAQYDVYDAAFPTKQVMENYATAVSTKPSNSLFFGIECKPSSTACNELYIRNTPNATGDARMYDLATFVLATQGMPNSYTAGELWVSYDVDLFYPSINNSLNYYGNKIWHYSSSSGSNTFPWGGGAVRYSNLVGNVSSNASYPYAQNWGSNNSFYLPESYGSGTLQVVIILKLSASTGSAVAMGLNAIVNLTPSNILVGGNSTEATGFQLATGAQKQIFVGYYRINNPPPAAPRAGFTTSISIPTGTVYASAEIFMSFLPTDLV